MATVSTRSLWKGAISFGLVHVPVVLHSAVVQDRPKMRMLGQASGAPIGYKKIDKSTGEAVAKEDVVKGVEVDKGQYVSLSPEEIHEALPKSTQTIEIECFVRLEDVPVVYFDKPYYVSPASRGQKVYALLRDILKRTGRAGLGRIVVSTKQHLAIVTPMGDGLVVNLLRWATEVRDIAGLRLPGDAASVGVTERELKMGEQLVLDQSEEWQPERYHDEFKEKLAALVDAKQKAGGVTNVVELIGEELAPASADLVDLTDLLRRSLRSGAEAAPAARGRKDAGAASPRRKAANDDRVAQRAAAAAKPASRARSSVKPKGK
jgi:DNA end-binding protein Ku